MLQTWQCGSLTLMPVCFCVHNLELYLHIILRLVIFKWEIVEAPLGKGNDKLTILIALIVPWKGCSHGPYTFCLSKWILSLFSLSLLLLSFQSISIGHDHVQCIWSRLIDVAMPRGEGAYVAYLHVVTGWGSTVTSGVMEDVWEWPHGG